MKSLRSNKSNNFKIITFILLLTIVLTLGLGSVFADNVKSGDSVLRSDETIDETGFFSGEKVDIAGTVNGTTFVAGGDIKISGVIDGDLFVAGQTINITGTVNGSIMAAGQDISISSETANNIYSAGSNITLKSKNNGSAFLAGNKITIEEQANIARDLFIGGSQIFQRGILGRDFFASSDNTSISGTIGKDVKVTSEDLYIEDAEIKGNLKYDSTNKATISNDSKILGKTYWNKVEPTPKASRFSAAVFTGMLLSLVNLLIVWILIKLLRPRFWNRLALNIKEDTLKSLGFGALALIVTPTVILVLLLTIFFYPVMFILLCLYGIALYISKIIVSVYIGRLIGQKFNWQDKHKGIWSVLLGGLILSLLGIVPYLGMFVKLVTVLLGLGSIVIYAVNGRKK